MTTPLPSRLRESARELRDSGTTQDSLDWREIRDRSVARIAAELEQAADALEAGPWMPIETAPRGSGEDGPHNVNDPGYVEPPKLLLWTAEGPVVGYYDWYYHPGYGRGADPSESTWRNQDGGRTYGVTHWMPLPAAPAAQVAQEGDAGVAMNGGTK